MSKSYQPICSGENTPLNSSCCDPNLYTCLRNYTNIDIIIIVLLLLLTLNYIILSLIYIESSLILNKDDIAFFGIIFVLVFVSSFTILLLYITRFYLNLNIFLYLLILILIIIFFIISIFAYYYILINIKIY